MPNDPIQEPTPEQHEALHKIIDRLPRWSEQFEDHTTCRQTIASLRSMLDSQGRVSEQHHKRVQELATENERVLKLLSIAMGVLEYLADDKHLVPFPRTLARDALEQMATLEG